MRRKRYDASASTVAASELGVGFCVYMRREMARLTARDALWAVALVQCLFGSLLVFAVPVYSMLRKSIAVLAALHFISVCLNDGMGKVFDSEWGSQSGSVITFDRWSLRPGCAVC